MKSLTSENDNNKEWNIYQYDSKDFVMQSAPVVSMEKRLPKLNVVPDEVLFFQSMPSIQNTIKVSLQ